MLIGENFLLRMSRFSKEPYGDVGTTIILPVKLVLNASMAASAVSESPSIIKVRGSIIALYINFFLANAGICSGITS